ncbi:hypothetical protein J2S74_003041 [Evansella vedderi]|uniref:Uncharacterized protein n=1 Tax=Evansella vedderi TaxID=38282 RepID=A0ABT9ZWQ8_9BACI|nr:hypothetical protein [Evansella vedderi]MDQ0255659.1 hypothetical protein [Evansella vedderi]
MAKENKTIVGTDIDEVKRRNKQSGLSYNEAKVELARQRGFLKNN